MKAKQPPRLGMLVLQRLGPRNDALAGDLAEEYRAGRSAAWYWWQVLASVVVGATRRLWAHKWLGVQVVAAYVGIQAFLGYAWRFIWFRTPLSSQVQEFSDSVWGPSGPLVNALYRLISLVRVRSWTCFRAVEALHGRRQPHEGAANDFWKQAIHPGSQNVVAVDT